MKVYVVMGNDYPEAVLTSAVEADRFIANVEADDRRRNPNRLIKIHWRSYEFDLKWSAATCSSA